MNWRRCFGETADAHHSLVNCVLDGLPPRIVRESSRRALKISRTQAPSPSDWRLFSGRRKKKSPAIVDGAEG